MYTIRKVRAECTIDFAAEELKKYLRMMMPKAGEIAISYDPQAAESAFEAFRIDMGKYTYETERFFDFGPAIRSLKYLIAEMKN